MKAARTGVSAAVVLLGVAAGTHAASADSPTQQGWWSAAGPATAAMGADVPSDGLLVQGGPSTPNAFAALSFDLSSGGTPQSLTLKLAPNSNNVPNSSVKVCRLSGPFAPAQGGDIATAPQYDCTNAPTGAIDGDHITIDLSKLTATGELDIALVPASPTDRVALAKPDTSALTTSGGGSSTFADSSAAAPVDDTSSSSSMATASPSFAETAALPASDTPALPAPDAPATPAASATPTTEAQRSAQLSAAPVSSSNPTSGGHRWGVFLFLGGAGAAALLWLGAGASAGSRTEEAVAES